LIIQLLLCRQFLAMSSEAIDIFWSLLTAAAGAPSLAAITLRFNGSLSVSMGLSFGMLLVFGKKMRPLGVASSGGHWAWFFY
jgi:hypothetical protein